MSIYTGWFIHVLAVSTLFGSEALSQQHDSIVKQMFEVIYIYTLLKTSSYGGQMMNQFYCVNSLKKNFMLMCFKAECVPCVCVCFVVGHVLRCVLRVFLWAAEEHFSPGCSPLPGFNPAEDLPAGLVLRNHRNRHQPAGSPAGEWNILEI